MKKLFLLAIITMIAAATNGQTLQVTGDAISHNYGYGVATTTTMYSGTGVFPTTPICTLAVSVRTCLDDTTIRYADSLICNNPLWVMYEVRNGPTVLERLTMGVGAPSHPTITHLGPIPTQGYAYFYTTSGGTTLGPKDLCGVPILHHLPHEGGDLGETPSSVPYPYPNPTTGWITIPVEGVVTISDMKGSKMLSVPSTSKRIYLGGLPGGLYQVTIIEKEGRRKTFRVQKI